MPRKEYPWWDFYTRKPVYLLLVVLLASARTFIKIYSTLYQRKNKQVATVKSIAAVWYWPYDFPSASFTRLGRWKEYFEKEGIRFDNFYVGTMQAKVHEYEAGTWTSKYWFYIKILLQRLPQFTRLKNYDVVWIDRWFLPYYPSKTAHWEAALQKMCAKLIIDSTDGFDYLGNPELILDMFGRADRITVAYEGLYNFYQPKFGDKVQRFNYTIIEDSYKIRTSWEQKPKLTIGWMGSPDNFKYVKHIEKELQKVAKLHPFKFVIICRQDVEINVPHAEIEYHRYGSDYEDLIQSFDIGISPFTEKNFGNTGKIGMKHQEFLLCQIPQVCSPQGISEHAIDGENCLIADEIEEWAPAIIRLMEDEKLREKLALAGRKMCLKHYTFDGQWPLAKKALSEF
jgi:glycosyltransferase involved in cell wall biosynthesis